MNLRETIGALEQNNIQIALDVGVHQYCEINSNCPLAVELRRIINESGVTLEQLLEGFVAGQETPPVPTTYRLPEFDGKATIKVAGKSVELDFEDTLKTQLGDALAKKRDQLDGMGVRIEELGRQLYLSYLSQVDILRNTRTLPQLEFTTEDIIKANCFITSIGERYVFLFPRIYNPEYIVTRGIRYKMADKDIKKLITDVHIVYHITKERKILSARILDSHGNTFNHYHGRGEDCWGNFRIPEGWNGTLHSLDTLTTQMMRALATINKDSLISGHPDGMPNIDDLMERSTKLGEEGHTEEREQPEGGWTTDNADANAPVAHRRWGQGRRTTRPTAEGNRPTTGGTPTGAEVMRIRFGVTDVTRRPADYDILCTLCGRRFGNHYGNFPGMVCPRDHERGRLTPAPFTSEEEMMRRFGVTREPADFDVVCNLCGETFGEHFGTPPEVICPRDNQRGGQTQRPLTEEEEYFRRWGIRDGSTIASEAICVLCQRPWGEHSDWECPQ